MKSIFTLFALILTFSIKAQNLQTILNNGSLLSSVNTINCGSFDFNIETSSKIALRANTGFWAAKLSIDSNGNASLGADNTNLRVGLSGSLKFTISGDATPITGAAWYVWTTPKVAILQAAKMVYPAAPIKNNSITYLYGSLNDTIIKIDKDSLGLGGGGASLVLYKENPVSPVPPSANGTNSVSIGAFSSANGSGSISLMGGAEGDNAVAIMKGDARGDNSIAWQGVARGDYSLGFGTVEAQSFAEVAFGTFNTIYNPVDTVGFNASDRLFSVGNGTGDLSRSDAIIIYKHGGLQFHSITNSGLGSVPSPQAGTIFYCTDCTAVDGSTGVQVCYNGSVWKKAW